MSDKHVGWSRAFRERARVLEVTRQVWALPGAPAKMNATELPGLQGASSVRRGQWE